MAFNEIKLTLHHDTKRLPGMRYIDTPTGRLLISINRHEEDSSLTAVLPVHSVDTLGHAWLTFMTEVMGMKFDSPEWTALERRLFLDGAEPTEAAQIATKLQQYLRARAELEA